MTQALTLQPGTAPFPGYRLHLPIGRGGFSEVWEAEDELGRRVALKFMPTRDSNAAAKEVRSIQAMRQLNHPYLVRIDQVWCQPGYIVIAMELAEGSLADVREAYLAEYQTPMPPAEACNYLLPAAEALDFLHRKQHLKDGKRVAFQHCDIKPGNILVFGEQAKLADFGLAIETTQALTPRSPRGTPAFAAPEVFEGQVSERTDQFALAVTYCLLRGGRSPFPEVTRFSSGYKHPAPDLDMLTVPERPIITRALSVRPYGRWPTCGTMMRRLARLFEVMVDESGFDTVPD